MNLLCPLCCGQSFESKSDLIEHLSKYSRNISCPLCKNIFSTISHLLEHLLINNCSLVQGTVQEHQISSQLIQNEPNYQAKLYQPTEYKKGSFFNAVIETNNEPNQNEEKHLCDEDNESVEDHDISEMSGVDLDNKMYEELLDAKTYQSTELHSLEKSDHSDYTLITRNGLPPIISDNDGITNQSLDGAVISITTKRDLLKSEPEPIITMMEKDPESLTSEEGYSCNSCGISFTSVLDHIQNYHKDQDVVIEMNDSSSQDNIKAESIEFVSDKNTVQDNIPTSMPFVFNTISINSDLKVPEQWAFSKRVITDTGDIVVASVSDKAGDTVSTVMAELPIEQEEPPPVKKTRRYKKRDEHNGTEADTSKKVELPYHQVVIKEVMTMNGSDKMKVYNCIICDIYVTDLDEFRAHPCKDLKYKCPNCPVSYENAKSLCAHMKAHKTLKVAKSQVNIAQTETCSPTLPAVEEIFKCNVCATVFPTNKSLKLHKRMHYPVKSRPIEAPVEENQEPSKKDPEKYFCSKCNKLIPVVYRAVHTDYHGTAETYTCDICNKKFGSSSYLVMHMTVHNIDKAPVKKSDKSLPYTCLYCNRNFARPHEKVKHERIHTGEKPHSCEICGKSFRVSYCLTLHMRTHTGARPYVCQHCGKRFKAHSVYNHHLLTHSDVRAYKCPYCQKAFKTSVQLAGHKNSHTKPFSCTVCNRPFASLYAVRVHTETHRRANNLKFSCALCGASYARSFALKDHMRTQHKDQGNYEEEKSWQEVTVDQPEEQKKDNLPIDISVFDMNATDSEMIT